MTTVTIQIGNSDNKLSQQDWAAFVQQCDTIVAALQSRRHFFGSSLPFDKKQNACWVVNVPSARRETLRGSLQDLRRAFQQDAAAITWGDTEFV